MTVGLGDLAGLWRRVWLRAPGREDATTEVLWFQGARSFVDLRIPADLPDFGGVAALADLDAGGLVALARCEGFAGTTTVANGVCAWRREINLQGPEAGADVGALEMTPDGLVETGVAGDYAELWRHADRAPPETRALRDDHGRRAWVVWTETRFSLAWGRPGAMAGPPLGAALAAALADGDAAALVELFDMEFSHGRFDAGVGRIVLSTDPTRVGDAPFPCDALRDARLAIGLRGFDGRSTTGVWTDVAAG